MVRIALAPCSPFSVTEQLMVRSAELAEQLDVRLHTHFAENSEDDAFSLATFGCRPMEYLERTGWCTSRTWLAHAVMPNDDEVKRLGAAGVGAAHCPSSNLILASGISPVVDMRAAGVHVGLGVDGSSSADSASLWLEARQAMLLAKLKSGAHAGTARMALEVATIGGAGCLGRIGEIGEISVGAVGDLAIWQLTGPAFVTIDIDGHEMTVLSELKSAVLWVEFNHSNLAVIKTGIRETIGHPSSRARRKKDDSGDGTDDDNEQVEAPSNEA
jgi:cytosine/adenosine deaminase-related metal-dependent hydrolase